MLLEGTSVTGVMLTCQVCNTCVCKGSATEVSVCGAGLKVNGVNFPGNEPLCVGMGFGLLLAHWAVDLCL